LPRPQERRYAESIPYLDEKLHHERKRKKVLAQKKLHSQESRRRGDQKRKEVQPFYEKPKGVGRCVNPKSKGCCGGSCKVPIWQMMKFRGAENKRGGRQFKRPGGNRVVPLFGGWRVNYTDRDTTWLARNIKIKKPEGMPMVCQN